MSSEIREKKQSFAEILEEYSSKNNEAPYQNGADLGLGLLNELYFALKRYSRVPKFKPQAKEQKKRDIPQEEKAVNPAKPWTSAEKAALSFFLSHGESEPTSLRELKRAFRRLARRFHPDARPNATESEKTALNVKFRQLRQAYVGLEGHFMNEAHSESKAAG
jgi:hypothetical protein